MSDKQAWLDALGIPEDRAFTFDLESCPDDSACACATCRSYASNDDEQSAEGEK